MRKRMMLTGLAGLVLLALMPLDAPGGPLFRVRAKFLNFDFTESATANSPGGAGLLLYGDLIFVPDLTSIGLGNFNTVFVHISSSGDLHSNSGGSNNMQLECEVDGILCNPGFTFASGVPGWIRVNRHENYNLFYGPGFIAPDGSGAGSEDMHDNNVTYTWCAPITPGVHFVGVRMASGNGIDAVFTEASHFYVDLARLPAASACVPAP